jgi:hypothetical protein
MAKRYCARIRYEGTDYYVDEDVDPCMLSPKAELLADGIELPEGDTCDELLDLPRGALADERDPDDEAACRADHQMDQERDDRDTGDR